MTPRRCARLRGSTLLEVALAVALMATTCVGLIATQLALSRHGQSAALRGQAAFVADAFAEMAVEGHSGVGAGEQWKARVSVLIPGGSVSHSVAGIDASIATVSWPRKPYGPAPAHGGAAMPCAGAPASPDRDCVSLGFAR